MAKLKVAGTIFVALLTILPASMSADDKGTSKTTPNTQRPAAAASKPAQGSQQVIKGNISKPPPPVKTKQPPPPAKK
jgi:hypothetical protein